MSTTPHPVYWNGSIVNDEDLTPLSSKFKLSYALVADVVDQLRQKGSINVLQYAGTPRERINLLLGEVRCSPPDEEPAPAPVSTTSIHPINEFAPAPATDYQNVVSDAAVSLIQAMADTGNGHFIITPDGCCAINRDNPPEITHAYQVVANVLKLRELAPAVEDKSAWMLGSVVASLEEFFGEDFSVSQVCELESQAYNTIAQKVAVFKRFKDKRYDLPYSHHQEAHYAKIHDDDKTNRAAQEVILSKAESYDLSSKNIRSLCSIAKTMEDDQVIRNIKSREQAMDLIAAYKDSRCQFLVYNEGAWRRFTAMPDPLPEGKVVIDLKNWKAYANGEAVDIVKSSK